jgi:acetolactate synthase-1/2/3 large subunit
MPTGADFVARALRSVGASHAFGIPGGEVLALLAALDRVGIRFLLAKHENAAGFMAEGVWHVTGALPVLVATLGPGVANAVNVVANAQQDRVPLVFVTGCVGEAEAESYTHQVFDHRAVLRPLVKASFRAAPGTEDLVVRKAVAIARSGRPGPVHIDLPVNVAEASSPARALPTTPNRRQGRVDGDEAVRLIRAARRPLVLAGLDVVNEGCSAALAAFVRRSGAALLTTYKAKGVLPEDDAAVIGAVGLSPKADALVRPLLDAADLVILAGYDPIEMRAGWRNPFPAATPVIDIVAEDIQHGMHAATLVMAGPVGPALAGLTEVLPPVPDRAPWPDDLPKHVRAALRDAFTPPPGWGPGTVFQTLREAAPAETVVTADSGAHRILLSQTWRCASPRTLLQSTGLCTMGCALPLAAGAALAGDAPTLCFVGDAGLEMVLGELATVRDLRLSVVVVVLVDETLGLIAMKQRASGLDSLGVSFGATDFAGVARAMGGHGVVVSDGDALREEARDAFRRDGFTVIACAIGQRAYDGTF